MINFHLSANSPAIDKGTSTNAPTFDYDGNPRPSGKGIDIGAYEYTVGGQTGMVTFTGQVSAQVSPRPVIIIVTKPGGTTTTVNSITDANRNYSATYTDIAGSYSAKATAAADSTYDTATSAVVSFTIGLTPSTITLNVA
jgi:hypothetical protein